MNRFDAVNAIYDRGWGLKDFFCLLAAANDLRLSRSIGLGGATIRGSPGAWELSLAF